MLHIIFEHFEVWVRILCEELVSSLGVLGHQGTLTGCKFPRKLRLFQSKFCFIKTFAQLMLFFETSSYLK